VLSSFSASASLPETFFNAPSTPQWFKFDDSRAEQFSESSVQEAHANNAANVYLLMFRRRDQ
jgi:hypothetical protein